MDRARVYLEVGAAIFGLWISSSSLSSDSLSEEPALKKRDIIYSKYNASLFAVKANFVQHSTHTHSFRLWLLIRSRFFGGSSVVY